MQRESTSHVTAHRSHHRPEKCLRAEPYQLEGNLLKKHKPLVQRIVSRGPEWSVVPPSLCCCSLVLRVLKTGYRADAVRMLIFASAPSPDFQRSQPKQSASKNTFAV